SQHTYILAQSMAYDKKLRTEADTGDS
ncbi:hypothetical protein Xen7305DRAFT_00038580, partial [Xenococcus sp. PCC 7305]